MSVIWKYSLSDRTTLEMPAGAQILSVQGQGMDICMWAQVHPNRRVVKRQFVVYGTGHPIPDDEDFTYVGTAQLANGGLVFHVFEIAQKPPTLRKEIPVQIS